MSLIPALPPSDARSLAAVGLDAPSPDIRRTPEGQIDYEWYLSRARRVRGQTYSGLFQAVQRRIAALLKSIREHRARKRALAELLSLDDRGLRDLGLARAGVYFAVDHGREDVPAPANVNDKSSRSVA